MSSFGIYVHWPYCTRICPYCDFNVYRARGADSAPLIEAICTDIAAHAARFGKREAASVFFGGGTPSLLKGDEISRILDAVARAYALALDCEITLEANPEDAGMFTEQAAAGINRFSLGVQALDDGALKALGRSHNAASALRAVEAAARTGRRVSLDLIYAREGQGIDAWRAELREALKLPVEHVSLYQLTIEPETAFARRVARGNLAAPTDEQAAAFYEATQEVCDAGGFPAYEISNHARTLEARSRHNLLYWRGGDWIGVGPGGHGRVIQAGARVATEAQRRSTDYIDAVREHGIGWLEDAVLSAEEASDEALMMGLRIDEGIDIARIEGMRGKTLNSDTLRWLEEEGLVSVGDGCARLTRAGRVLANRVAAELVS